jgi:phage virion morphogenesis protein
MSVYSGAEFEGLKEAVSALDRFADNIAARRKALDQLGQLGTDAAQNRIYSQGPGPAGEIWPKLNKDYAASIKGGPMLQRSGGLYQSLQQEVIGDDAVLVGSNMQYAAVHQFGAKITGKGGGNLVFNIGARKVFVKSVTIPARPYLGFSDAEIADAHTTLSQWIEATFEASFGGRLA